MTIFQVCGAVAVFMIFLVCVGRGKGGIGAVAAAATSVMLVLASLEKIIPMVSYIKELSGNVEYGEYILILIKCLGVGFVCSWTSEMCRDSGENSIASGIEFFGKSEIIMLCLPIVKSLLELAGNVMRTG